MVLDHVRELQEVRGDRCFARVASELRDSIRNSMLEGLFREVSGKLHSRPGYEPAGSFKTADLYGNLQVTFLRRVMKLWPISTSTMPRDWNMCFRWLAMH